MTKKILSDIRTMAALLMASATLAACSSEDNITDEQPVQPTGQVYTMTVSASKGGDDADSRATTRALSLGGVDNKTLNAAWAEGERVTVYNVTRSTDLGGTLVAQASGASTTLKGELTGTVAKGDQLTLKFLSPDYNTQDGTQTGSATSIDRVCDYAEATVTVASVADGNITTTAAADFQNRQAIVKFILKDESGNDLNVSSLTISAESNRLVSAGGLRGTGDKTYYTEYTVDAGTGNTGVNGGYDQILDGNTGTKWCVNTSTKSDGVWYVEFHTASAVQVDGYKLTTADDTQSYSERNPKNWTLKAKVNNGDAWTVIDTKTGNTDMPGANLSSVDFETDVQGMYQYFRLEVSAVQSGEWLQLSEMQLYGCSDRAVSFLYGNINVTPAAATSELTVALNNQSGASDTYTLTTNVGGIGYIFTKSGVTFESGKYYAITVKMKKRAAANVTDEDLGKIIGADGNIYDTQTAASSGGTYSVAMIAYVGNETDNATYKHGLAIALYHENNRAEIKWEVAKSACEGKTAVSGAQWQLPSRNQWKAMLKANGGNEGKWGGLNAALTAVGVAETHLLQSQSGYWTSTEDTMGDNADYIYFSNNGSAAFYGCAKAVTQRARACLVF